MKWCLALAANHRLKRDGPRSIYLADSRVGFMDRDGCVLAHLSAHTATCAARVLERNAFPPIGLKWVRLVFQCVLRTQPDTSHARSAVQGIDLNLPQRWFKARVRISCKVQDDAAALAGHHPSSSGAGF
jgi:hypothetical protein